MINRDSTKDGVGEGDHLGLKGVTGGTFQREFVDLVMIGFSGCHVFVVARVRNYVNELRAAPRRTALRPRRLPGAPASG